MQFGKPLPVGENVKAECIRPISKPAFCVPDDFQTGFILGGKGIGKNSTL